MNPKRHDPQASQAEYPFDMDNDYQSNILLHVKYLIKSHSSMLENIFYFD